MLTRLKRLLIVEPITLRFILGVVGLLLSLGFMLGSSTNENYKLVEGFMSFYLWGMLLFGYASSKFVQLILDMKCWFRAASSLVGMWIWSFIFMSFTLFDSTPLVPTEMMLLTPVLAEVWSLAGTMYTYNKERIK